ncbi:hypothetical protein [Streptomyces mirabilis]
MAGGGGARSLSRRAGDRGLITVFRWGDAARRDFIREHVMTGRHHLAVGLGEPNGGSDAAAPRTAAEDHGHHFLLPQTVGVHPDTCEAEPRGALACAGVQRVVSLGRAGGMPPGLSATASTPCSASCAG